MPLAELSLEKGRRNLEPFSRTVPLHNALKNKQSHSSWDFLCFESQNIFIVKYFLSILSNFLSESKKIIDNGL